MAKDMESEFLTYSWIRDEEWMVLHRPSEVRRFLQHYGAWEDTLVFSRGRHSDGTRFYLEVPRNQWLEMFGVEG
jgi:hypothetical protein